MRQYQIIAKIVSKSSCAGVIISTAQPSGEQYTQHRKGCSSCFRCKTEQVRRGSNLFVVEKAACR